jgi:ribosomal 50S subunit-recycling heat shock protein
VVVNGQRVESSSVVSTGDRIHVGEPPREIILVTLVG